MCYPHLEKGDLAQAKAIICKKLIGCERFIDRFIEKLDIFTSRIYQPSKGILLFGPPGTGKSAISSDFCKESGFRFVC